MVSPLSSLVRFAVGNAFGVIALVALIVVLDQGDLQSGALGRHDVGACQLFLLRCNHWRLRASASQTSVTALDVAARIYCCAVAIRIGFLASILVAPAVRGDFRWHTPGTCWLQLPQCGYWLSAFSRAPSNQTMELTATRFEFTL